MNTEQAHADIARLVTGNFRVNTYLVSCRKTGEGVVIDPGGEPDRILAAIHSAGLTIKYILNTHGHADHRLANHDLREALKVPVCLHEDDDEFFARPEIRKISAKELGLSVRDRADVRLRDGDLLQVGELEFAIIHTPGHSPGSVCFLTAGNLFTGDTLFVGDVGRSDLTGGSFATLLQSIKERIITLPPETVVHPGHDYGETPTSTLAWELRENPYITDFILAS
ncbi:MAG: MBL fold metallo-hydrolase [Desulfobulbus sp.]|jgi:glyoxylase-like metal-dependent hydrolase (beta-lactamase superfamily II)|nr:MAG: MBL fold metallo-hydrolase [Desulfobulbus sp.]